MAENIDDFHYNSNLRILQEVKKNYTPGTAFANKKLLKLLSSIREPNKDGRFETDGIVEETTIYSISWRCVDCGKKHYERFVCEEVESGDIIERRCDCNKIHKVTIVDYSLTGG